MAITENAYSARQLEELKGSKYEIADGQPNIIGWDVKNEAGTKYGDVKNILFDPESRRVRYLVIKTDDRKLGLADRKILVPIGVAQLHKDKDEVTLPGITVGHLASLPEYENNKLNEKDELAIRNVFANDKDNAAVAANKDFYHHELYDEDQFYRHANRSNDASYTNDDKYRRANMKGDVDVSKENDNNTSERRRDKVESTTGKESTTIPVVKENVSIGKEEVESGGVRVSSRLVERPVEKDINLQQEHVNVTRTPVDREVTDADNAFKEMDIEITEHSEVPVVKKEARVVEEVTVNKTVEEKEETIRDTVRNTEVDIEKLEGEKIRGKV